MGKPARPRTQTNEPQVALTAAYRPQQKQYVAHTCPAQHILYGGAVGGGKGLALDTPIPTPVGWTTMGALRVGDRVIAPDGSPTQVVNVSETHHRPCYRMTTTDGAVLIADDQHLWDVYTESDRSKRSRRTDAFRERRRASRGSRVAGNRSSAQSLAIIERNRLHRPGALDAHEGRVVDTVTLASLMHTERHRVSIRMHDGFDLPDSDVPLDPYLFGTWLGDGASAGGRMACHEDDYPIIAAWERGGFTVRKYQRHDWGIHNLVGTLRSMGVLHNKHIPILYRRAGRAQRLALLQGLMDTDGHAGADGKCEFTTIRASLAAHVVELIRSLGWRANVREGRATLNGRDISAKYRIVFTATEAVFRLPRKCERQRVAGERTRWRYIASIEPVDPVPTRCIMVDHPLSCYLAGESMLVTHNSAWGLNEVIAFGADHPGAHQLVVRRVTKELRKLIRDTRLWLPPALSDYNANQMTFTFKDAHPERGRGTITFSHIHHDEDVAQHYGFEYTRIFVDESTHFNQWVHQQLQSRNRCPLYPSEVKYLRGTNPGNIGHHDHLIEYVKPPYRDVELLYYFDPLAPSDWPGYEGSWNKFPAGFNGRPAPMIVWRPPKDERWDAINRLRVVQGLDEAEPPTRCYIPALIQDNRYLWEDPAYTATLLALPEKMQRALMHGDWNAFEGQVLTEFDEKIHVIDGIDIQGHWQLWRSLDWGYEAPLAMYWHAWSPERQQVVTYRELYMTGLLDRDTCRMTLDMTPRNERISFTAADPSMFRGDSNDDAESHADAYARHGVTLIRAINDRINGLAKVRDFLAPNLKTGNPNWVVTRDCRNLIRTLPTLIHDPERPEDIKEGGEDHAYDSLRYGLMMAPNYMKARRRTPMNAGYFRTYAT